MKGIPEKKVVFAIVFSAFLIVSSIKVSASGQATILATHLGFVDRLGYYRVVGEVENVGDRNVRYARVNATFQDVTNTIIASRSSYVMLDVLLPGRRAPFEIVLGNKTASTQVDHYSLSLLSEEYPAEKLSLLQIMESTTFIDEAGFQKVNGTVKNLATSNATYVKVAATFYNLQGKVVGATSSYVSPSPPTILPNQTKRFELELAEKAGNFSGYTLATESAEYSLISAAPTTLTVSINLNATNVNSGANVAVHVHVTNVTLPVKDASIRLVSNKGGAFNPQAGYTNSTGDFAVTFTTPTVTANTTITITANATKTGFIVGQGLKQITVKTVSSAPAENGQKPTLSPLTSFVAAAIVIILIGGVLAVSRRKRGRPRL